jgi:hypothetical protein
MLQLGMELKLKDEKQAILRKLLNLFRSSTLSPHCYCTMKGIYTFIHAVPGMPVPLLSACHKDYIEIL